MYNNSPSNVDWQWYNLQTVKKEEGEEAKEGEKDAENKEANGAVSTGEDAAVEGGKYVYCYVAIEKNHNVLWDFKCALFSEEKKEATEKAEDEETKEEQPEVKEEEKEEKKEEEPAAEEKKEENAEEKKDETTEEKTE